MANAAQMKWPTQAKVREFFGEPGNPKCTAGMADVYPMRIAWSKSDIVRRFRCHSLVEQSMETIFRNALAHYGQAQLTKLGLDLFGGCYNLRQMRGGSSWSMHSWGIAVDLDPERNQLKWGKDRAVFARAEYEPFWNIVEAAGATSLGRVANMDWQHFQFARLR